MVVFNELKHQHGAHATRYYVVKCSTGNTLAGGETLLLFLIAFTCTRAVAPQLQDETVPRATGSQ